MRKKICCLIWLLFQFDYSYRYHRKVINTRWSLVNRELVTITHFLYWVSHYGLAESWPWHKNHTLGSLVWRRMDTCMCMVESLLCSPKTITTLLIGSNPYNFFFNQDLIDEGNVHNNKTFIWLTWLFSFENNQNGIKPSSLTDSTTM